MSFQKNAFVSNYILIFIYLFILKKTLRRGFLFSDDV